jgi:hypothetical protein
VNQVITRFLRLLLRNAIRGPFSFLLLLSISARAYAFSPPILLSPTNGTIVVSGEHFTVSGTALDAQVTRIDFYEDDVLIRSVLNNTATFAWSNSTVGWHSYKLLAFDSQGAYATSGEAKLLTCRPDSLATFFPQFTSSAGLTLERSAAITGNYLSLTPNTTGKGAAWLPTKQPLTHGFDTVFQFRIADQVGGGADGIAFVIEGTPTAALGGGIGYGGVTNCLAVEYDTFLNPNHQDPNENHISVHSRGTLYNTNWESLASLGWTTNIPNMSDGAVHTTRILYIPPELQIFLDNMATPVLVIDVDLSTYLNLPSGSAWCRPGHSKPNSTTKCKMTERSQLLVIRGMMLL